jgi:hypothetical protein
MRIMPLGFRHTELAAHAMVVIFCIPRRPAGARHSRQTLMSPATVFCMLMPSLMVRSQGRGGMDDACCTCASISQPDLGCSSTGAI